jgi:nucleotide-binding universal stress UspA family protein
VLELKQILCPVDLSELSIQPLVYATGIARSYGGRVTALHVVPAFEPREIRAGALFDPVQFVYPMTREQVLDRLQQAVDSAGLTGAAISCAAEAGDAAPTIVDQCVTLGADLVVMATHGRSGFDRLLLGSVTEKVLRRAPCPVLTVPGAPGRAAGLSLERILCAVDFSPASLQALGFALDLARRADGAVTVVHVIEWLAEEDPREFRHFDVPEFRRGLMEDTAKTLETLIAQQQLPPRGARARVAAGRAYREILGIAAEDDANLIVIGAQGRGGAALTPFGSTTQQVVRAAACPVLTVRPA